MFSEAINGKVINESNKWTGLEWRVPPGKIQLYINAKVNSSMAAYDEFEFNAVAGKKYYVYRELGSSGVEIYIMENNEKKIYSNIVPAEKRRKPKYSYHVIII